LRNAADAEDVAQEALLRAYRNFARLREPARFRGWLVRITFRLALDRWRSAKRRGKRETEWLSPERRAAGPTAEEIAASLKVPAVVPKTPDHTMAAPPEVGRAPVVGTRGPRNAATAPKEQPTETPDVMVFAEEREAFARFVAKVPADPQRVVALTRPAPPGQDPAVEIALLQIETLKVNPLEPVAEE